MDPDQRIEKLEQLHASSSLLSGISNQREEPDQMDLLADRIDHLDPIACRAIRELSELQQNYPIRAYESEDGLRAGIICSDSLKLEQPEVVKRFSQLFFSDHHETICTVFEPELRQVGRRHGK